MGAHQPGKASFPETHGSHGAGEGTNAAGFCNPGFPPTSAYLLKVPRDHRPAQTMHGIVAFHPVAADGTRAAASAPAESPLPGGTRPAGLLPATGRGTDGRRRGHPLGGGCVALARGRSTPQACERSAGVRETIAEGFRPNGYIFRARR